MKVVEAINKVKHPAINHTLVKLGIVSNILTDENQERELFLQLESEAWQGL